MQIGQLTVVALIISGLTGGGCSRNPDTVPQKNNDPPMRAPSSYAIKPLPAPAADVPAHKPQKPATVEPTREPERAPTTASKIERRLEAREPPRRTEIKTPRGPHIDMQVEEEETDEKTAWLSEISDFEPGCLIGGGVPSIWLPSAETLAQIIRGQSESFGGVAREALLCRLQLPRLTGSDFYGRTAYVGQAKAITVNLKGSRQAQEVLVTTLRTESPRAYGTLIVVMEPAEETRNIRAMSWLPWTGPNRNRNLKSVRPLRLYGPKRRALAIRRGNNRHKTDTIVALTNTNELVKILELPVHKRGSDGARLSGQLTITGRGSPRTLVYRAASFDPTGAGTWTVTRFVPEGFTRARTDATRTGPVNLQTAAQALTDNRSSEALWLIDLLPKKIRIKSKAHELRARLATRRGRHRHAARHWKRALKAADATAETQRNYGLHLKTRKRKKGAIRALMAYIKAAPDAPDRRHIERVIAALRKGAK
jgi:hypothetical protein